MIYKIEVIVEAPAMTMFGVVNQAASALDGVFRLKQISVGKEEE